MKASELQSEIRNLKVIAGFFILSPALYLGVLWFMKNSGGYQPPVEQNLSMLTLVFAGVFASQIFLGLIFPRMRRASKVDQDWFRAYKNTSIVQYALYESGAIFGLVLGFMGAELMVSIAFSAVAIFFLLTIFPTEERLLKAKRV